MERGQGENTAPGRVFIGCLTVIALISGFFAVSFSGFWLPKFRRWTQLEMQLPAEGQTTKAKFTPEIDSEYSLYLYLDARDVLDSLILANARLYLMESDSLAALIKGSINLEWQILGPANTVVSHGWSDLSGTKPDSWKPDTIEVVVATFEAEEEEQYELTLRTISLGDTLKNRIIGTEIRFEQDRASNLAANSYTFGLMRPFAYVLGAISVLSFALAFFRWKIYPRLADHSHSSGQDRELDKEIPS